jgi:hypothetical protein
LPARWRGVGAAISLDPEPRLILAPSEAPRLNARIARRYDLGCAGLAPDLVAKIHAGLAARLQDPVVLTALETMDPAPVGSSPKDSDAFMRAEAAKWEPVLKEADIKMQ